MTFEEFEKAVRRFEKDFFISGRTKYLDQIEKKMNDNSKVIWDWFTIDGFFPHEYTQIDNRTGEKEKIRFENLHDLYNYLKEGKAA